MAEVGPIFLSAQAEDRVLWEYFYDNVSLNVTRFRCTNGTTDAALARMWQTDNPDQVYEKRTPANTTDTVNIPQNVANRLQIKLVPSPRGPRLDGIAGEYSWPVA